MRLFEGLPFWLTFVIFFIGAFVRGNLTYWVGRGLRRGSANTRLGRHLDGPAMARAARIIERVGAPAVSLSFLTVGVQTAINASAGVLRMPLRWYLPAVTVGAVLWSGDGRLHRLGGRGARRLVGGAGADRRRRGGDPRGPLVVAPPTWRRRDLTSPPPRPAPTPGGPGGHPGMRARHGQARPIWRGAPRRTRAPDPGVRA